MAVEAMLAVKTINNRGEIKYPVKAVNILKAHGKSARDSLFVKGYALNCTVASQGNIICVIKLFVSLNLNLDFNFSYEDACYERKNCLSRY